ncbi:ThuA domain-containing protein [Agromyces ramosus]|uniref:Type 1 glutamine amidotransferase n=1 Tax=Agromyces ramosus TaxID=33879 RepID=A0ABU0RAU2_9MICO|nr:ThuA domain-containing protein [Agromyces ramosus]MDQ0895178.1 type 1 glutamine amidotransferase [Agromyces ramosus]
MHDAIILSGTGRYADPWHPFADTSEALADLVRDAGFTVRIADDPDAALASLDDAARLIVVNAGDPLGPNANAGAGADGDRPVPPEASVIAAGDAALDAAIDRGIGILAVHAAASSLRDHTTFGRALGGRWLRDVSWHPPIGEAHVHVVGNHAIVEGLDDFTVFDERYTGLRLLDVVEPIAEHTEGGVRHPLVWAREFGRSRLVYDALGHDTRSYESAGHRELLARALDWLSRVPAATAGDA